MLTDLAALRVFPPPSCTMIISAPNDFVAEVHDRMPVLLKSRSVRVEELKPAPNDYLQRRSVPKRVNSSKADTNDSTLIEAIEPTVEASLL